jgi:DNA-binding XRE family transcriptional regulator
MRHITHEEVMTDLLQDPEFKAIWEANATKRQITMAIIGERIKRKLSQEELAHKAGLKQPSIARVEGGSVMPSITTLNKIAKAFGKRLDIRFS